MTIKQLACAAALAATLPMPLSAASLDYFLKIDGIQGESLDDKHKSWIDVLSWSWGVSNTHVSTGGGGGASRPVFADFSWEQGLDTSFVPLFLAAADGKHVKEALMEVTRLGKDSAPFFQIELRDVYVTKLTAVGSGDAIKVNGAFAYDEITLRYRKQNADGSYGSYIQGTFNLKENSVSFVGDPGVVQGLVEAGGTLNFINQVPEPATWVSLSAGLALVAVALRRRRGSAGQPPG